MPGAIGLTRAPAHKWPLWKVPANLYWKGAPLSSCEGGVFFWFSAEVQEIEDCSVRKSRRSVNSTPFDSNTATPRPTPMVFDAFPYSSQLPNIHSIRYTQSPRPLFHAQTSAPIALSHAFPPADSRRPFPATPPPNPQPGNWSANFRTRPPSALRPSAPHPLPLDAASQIV